MEQNSHLIYLDIAKSISKLSPDTQRKVGSVLVEISKNNSECLSKHKIIGIGYNDFINSNYISNKIYNLCSVLNRSDFKSNIIHAEVNCILNSTKNFDENKEYAIYCTLMPCLECLKYIINSRIKYIYYIEEKNNEESKYVKEMVKNYNVSLIQINDLNIESILLF